MAVKASADEVHRVISTAVDPAFYRTVYPDVGAAGTDALWHYMVAGWREGRDPAPWFSNRAYLKAYPDVRRQGVDPLFHFLTRGAREGREVEPSEHARTYLRLMDSDALPPPAQPPQPARQPAPQPVFTPTAAADPVADERMAIAAEFDAKYYLTAYPDVAAAGMDPLQHFVTTGWREGRNPNARFSTDDYLEANPDVGAAGVNPFWHYIRSGRAEGREQRFDLGFRYRVIARRPSIAERIGRAARAAGEVKTGSASELARRLAAAATTGLADLHVTFSHDDYTAVIGGLQLCVRRESAGVRARGVDHLHIHPAVVWPVMRQADDAGPMGVLLNGEPLGAYAAADVRAALKKAAAGVKPGRRSLAVHSLLGHAVDEVVAVAKTLGLKAAVFWLHDFASLCAGFHLVRNDVEDCAAPPPDSAACSICDYGTERGRHLEGHRRLFEALDVTVAAPSAVTLDFWRASWDFPVRGAVVLPHAELIPAGPAPRRRGKLRVAFLGLPIPLKGWPLFAELAQRHADDKRYEFLHIGARPDPDVPAAFHAAVADESRPNAMREAIEALQVDVALIWPICRETFSFVAYEAVAAGAAVITGPDSGNVAAFVQDGGHGLVLQSEAGLAEAFENGAVLDLSRTRRKAVLHDLRFSALTADLMAEAGE